MEQNLGIIRKVHSHLYTLLPEDVDGKDDAYSRFVSTLLRHKG